ncbi:MAG: hypothetical protein LBS19_13255 [Clostridiales bacterium]|jgi:hypothetical protein|nr:hypothetical protein [Clostridiales bacterium]
MKEKHVRILTALVLSLALAAGSAGAVLGAQSGVLIGENDVTSMVLRVTVPNDLSFVFDPLELEAEGGSQIAPADYFFINYTGAPIKVSLDITLELGDGVTLVDSPGVLGKDDIEATDKNIFFAILGADALPEGELDFTSGAAEPVKGIYDAAKDTLIPFDPITASASMEFILASATESFPGQGYDTLAEGSMGVGAFRFYAEMNTYANWKTGDVKVMCSYTLAPLRIPAYENYLAGDNFTQGGWGTQLRSGAFEPFSLPQAPVYTPRPEMTAPPALTATPTPIPAPTPTEPPVITPSPEPEESAAPAATLPPAEGETTVTS